jgi:hypothetical protein
MLFSATFPITVKSFKDKHLRDPHIVNLMEKLTLRVRCRDCMLLACAVVGMAIIARCLPSVERLL